jgi:hypothetical protein
MLGKIGRDVRGGQNKHRQSICSELLAKVIRAVTREPCEHNFTGILRQLSHQFGPLAGHVSDTGQNLNHFR